jgi:serine/threonine protein kinase
MDKLIDKDSKAFFDQLMNAFEDNEFKFLNPDDYPIDEKTELLGSGNFGSVYKVQKGDEIFAVKILNKVTEVKMNLLELLTLKKFNDPRILKFNGVFARNFQVHIVFDYLEGLDFEKYLELQKKKEKEKEKCKENNIEVKDPPISNSEKLELCIQLTEIIGLLHKENIIHRDIKPGNMMISSKNILTLIDFGLARINTKNVSSTCSAKGTYTYSPPETVIDQSQYSDRVEYNVSTKFDVWSVGCVIYEIFSGQLPWKKIGIDQGVIMTQLVKFTLKLKMIDPKFIKNYPLLYDVLKKVFIVDVSQRISCDQLLAELINLREKL